MCLVLTGLGIGRTLPVQSVATTGLLPAHSYGIGSAISPSFRQLGAGIGISLVAAVDRPSPGDALHAYERI
ncbi:hypothetical protein WKI65_28195 [Streptomyces sp. MS1.AVA.3]|uniref:hypothetical protein n=1 Tax=Streptomyces decoyicus TaxID=249567 RepID=UPI0030BDD5A9